MPAVAPVTAGTQDGAVQSAGWSGEVKDPGAREGNRMQFSEDGLDTGVRVRSMQLSWNCMRGAADSDHR